MFWDSLSASNTFMLMLIFFKSSFVGWIIGLVLGMGIPTLFIASFRLSHTDINIIIDASITVINRQMLLNDSEQFFPTHPTEKVLGHPFCENEDRSSSQYSMLFFK
jgi:hypothetical protein